MGCCSAGGVDKSRDSNMDKGYAGVQIPGERRIQSGPISKTSHAVCACPFTLQDMVLNIDLSDTEGEQAVKLNNNILVSMEWCGFQGA